MFRQKISFALLDNSKYSREGKKQTPEDMDVQPTSPHQHTNEQPEFVLDGEGYQRVLPYFHSYTSNIKSRWIGRTLRDVFLTEFPYQTPEYCDAAIASGRLRLMRRPLTSGNARTGRSSKKSKSTSVAVPVPPEEVITTEKDDGHGEEIRLVQVPTCLADDVMEHSMHRHELPVIHTGPIVIEAFVSADTFLPSPNSTPSSSSTSVATQPMNGLIVVRKPPSIPVHACGRYKKNCVINMITAGYFTFSDEARRSLTQSTASAFGDEKKKVDGHEGDRLERLVATLRSGAVHVVHRLDKCTSGVLIFATSTAVAAHLMGVLVKKSDEEEAQAAASAQKKAEGAAPAKRNRDDDDGDGDGSDGPAKTTTAESASTTDSTCGKQYLARVLGKFPGGQLVTVNRGIYVVNKREGVQASLTLEQEEERQKRSVAELAQAAAAAAEAKNNGDTGNGNNNNKNKNKNDPHNGTLKGKRDDNNQGPDLARWALSTFRLVSYDEQRDESVVECRPVTGRTHQLRVHLGHVLGFPILLDELYTQGEELLQRQQQLSADVERVSSLFGVATWLGSAGAGGVVACDGAIVRPNAVGVVNPASPPPTVDGCPECMSTPEDEKAAMSGAVICLHAHRYSIPVAAGGGSVGFTAPPPPWAALNMTNTSSAVKR